MGIKGFNRIVLKWLPLLSCSTAPGKFWTVLQGSAAPVASWSAARVSSDLALSKDLMLKLDAEKGIAENALLPQAKQEPMETGNALLVVPIDMVNGPPQLHPRRFMLFLRSSMVSCTGRVR